MACIFCKLAANELPGAVLHETENLVVVKDINPQAPTHLLVIPKRHVASLTECDDAAILGEMLSLAKIAAKDAGIMEKGFRVVVNTNDDGGQTVFHLHMHVLGGRPLSGMMG